MSTGRLIGVIGGTMIASSVLFNLEQQANNEVYSLARLILVDKNNPKLTTVAGLMTKIGSIGGSMLFSAPALPTETDATSLISALYKKVSNTLVAVTAEELAYWNKEWLLYINPRFTTTWTSGTEFTRLELVCRFIDNWATVFEQYSVNDTRPINATDKLALARKRISNKIMNLMSSVEDSYEYAEFGVNSDVRASNYTNALTGNTAGLAAYQAELAACTSEADIDSALTGNLGSSYNLGIQAEWESRINAVLVAYPGTFLPGSLNFNTIGVTLPNVRPETEYNISRVLREMLPESPELLDWWARVISNRQLFESLNPELLHAIMVAWEAQMKTGTWVASTTPAVPGYTGIGASTVDQETAVIWSDWLKRIELGTFKVNVSVATNKLYTLEDLQDINSDCNRLGGAVRKNINQAVVVIIGKENRAVGNGSRHSALTGHAQAQRQAAIGAVGSRVGGHESGNAFATKLASQDDQATGWVPTMYYQSRWGGMWVKRHGLNATTSIVPARITAVVNNAGVVIRKAGTIKPVLGIKWNFNLFPGMNLINSDKVSVSDTVSQVGVPWLVDQYTGGSYLGLNNLVVNGFKGGEPVLRFVQRGDTNVWDVYQQPNHWSRFRDAPKWTPYNTALNPSANGNVYVVHVIELADLVWQPAQWVMPSDWEGRHI